MSEETEKNGFRKVSDQLEKLIIALSASMPILNVLYNHYRELAEDKDD